MALCTLCPPSTPGSSFRCPLETRGVLPTNRPSARLPSALPRSSLLPRLATLHCCGIGLLLPIGFSSRNDGVNCLLFQMLIIDGASRCKHVTSIGAKGKVRVEINMDTPEECTRVLDTAEESSGEENLSSWRDPRMEKRGDGNLELPNSDARFASHEKMNVSGLSDSGKRCKSDAQGHTSDHRSLGEVARNIRSIEERFLNRKSCHSDRKKTNPTTLFEEDEAAADTISLKQVSYLLSWSPNSNPSRGRARKDGDKMGILGTTGQWKQGSYGVGWVLKAGGRMTRAMASKGAWRGAGRGLGGGGGGGEVVPMSRRMQVDEGGESEEEAETHTRKKMEDDLLSLEEAVIDQDAGRTPADYSRRADIFSRSAQFFAATKTARERALSSPAKLEEFQMTEDR